MSKIDLLRHTNEITTIECSSCNKVDTVKDAAEQAIDELYKKGWRTKKGECKCPSCASGTKKYAEFGSTEDRHNKELVAC